MTKITKKSKINDKFSANNENANHIDNKHRSLIFRVAIVLIILVSIVTIYFIKNPLGGGNNSKEYDSSEFALDATDNFDMEELLSYNMPMIIDFGADSCEPCKLMAPILEELNQELRGKAIIKFIDVWKNSSAGSDFPIQAIPTQFFFNADGSPYVFEDPETAARQGFIMYTLRDTGEHVYTAHQGFLDKESMLDILKEMGLE